MENLKRFAVKSSPINDEAGYVPSGVGKASNKAGADRIARPRLMTTGIVEVARCAAATAGVEKATIASG